MSKLSKTHKQSSSEALNISELRDKALTSRSAKEIESIIREILLSKASDTERGAALLQIGIGRHDLPHIRVRALSVLSHVDPSATRTLVKHILEQPVDPDSTHVRATAYSALIKLQKKTTADVTLIVAGLREGLEVQGSIKEALEDLSQDQLQSLKDLAATDPESSASLLKTIELIVAETVRHSPRSGTTPLAALKVPVKKPRPDPSEKNGHPNKRFDHAPENESVPPTPPTITTPRATRAPVGPLQSSVVKAHDVGTQALETLRVEKFRSLDWNHLVHQLDSLQDPVQLCQCMA